MFDTRISIVKCYWLLGLKFSLSCRWSWPWGLRLLPLYWRPLDSVLVWNILTAVLPLTSHRRYTLFTFTWLLRNLHRWSFRFCFGFRWTNRETREAEAWSGLFLRLFSDFIRCSCCRLVSDRHRPSFRGIIFHFWIGYRYIKFIFFLIS